MFHVSLVLVAGGLASAYTVVNVDQFMFKNIDPIVFPGQYKSHLHSFFGSDAVTINTTTSAELQAGCSTAQNPNDLSSYWIPSLIVNGTTTVRPFRFSAYYVQIEKAEIPIPQDFRAVAGNPRATSQADVESLAGIEWFCEGGPGKPEGTDKAAFPTETCNTHLQTLLLFPDCVNPETLNSTYSGTHNWISWDYPENRCPEDMKRIPQLRFSIRYDLRRTLPNGWSGKPPIELASGSSYSTHGDFINGWLPEAAETMLQAPGRAFLGIDGPAGAYNAGPTCGAGAAADADPDNGTGDFRESVEVLSKRGLTTGGPTSRRNSK